MADVTVQVWRLDASGTPTIAGDEAVRFTNLSFSDVLSEPGSGSISLPYGEAARDELEHDGLDLVQILIQGIPAFVIYPDPSHIITIAEGEEADEPENVSGPGLLAVLDRARVYPTGGVNRLPKETERNLNWASPLYDLTGLPNAEVMLTTAFGAGWAGGGISGGWASDWPLINFSNIYWADNPGGNPSTYLSADAGECWFFRDVTFPNDGLYRFFGAADDSMEVFLDGQQVMSVTGYGSTTTGDIEVTAGSHRVAIHGRNGTGTALDDIPGWYIGPGGFSLEIAEVTLIGLDWIGLPEDELYVVAYEDEPPGTTPGAALILVLEEAQARGWFPDLTWDFTETEDSDGTAWDETSDIATRVGVSILDFVRELAVTYMDVEMDPDVAGGLVLHAWRKGEKGTALAEAYAQGVNLRALEHQRENLPTNTLLVETEEKWIEVNDPTSETAYGRSESSISLGAAPSIAEATRVAEAQLDVFLNPREQINAVIEPVDSDGNEDLDLIPYVGVRTGDTVTVPDSTGATDAERLLSIAVTQESETGRAEFTLAFRDVILGPEERLSLSVRRGA